MNFNPTIMPNREREREKERKREREKERKRERERVNSSRQIFGITLKTAAVFFCAGFLFFGLAGQASAATY